MAKPSDIAYCKRGQLGLITRVVKSSGCHIHKHNIYKGIDLSSHRFGKPWQSRDPKVVGNIHDLLNSDMVSNIHDLLNSEEK